jgi:Uma2 family endonuclease
MAIIAREAEYTPEKYLALERKAECKSEYINGRIFAMAGASRQHNQITFNISVELGTQLKGRPCVAYSSDMRVKVTETGLYAYPDIVVTCNEPQFEDSFLDTLLNPTIIIEVLSESTEAYDRGGKFAHYRRLSSLEEFILIAQDGIYVEQYIRKGKQWILSEIVGIDEKIQLNSTNCYLSLRDIYHKVELSDKERFSFITNLGDSAY